MNNYPTILGQDPCLEGIAPGSGYPHIPRRLISDPHVASVGMSLGEERLYRFPLVVRIEQFRGSRRLPGGWYRWMLYQLPYETSLKLIEAELRALNKLRASRNECDYPLLAVDIASNNWSGCGTRFGGEFVDRAPVFIPASPEFSLTD